VNPSLEACVRLPASHSPGHWHRDLTSLGGKPPRLAERFGASDDPWRRRLFPERVCVRPFRDPGGQDVRQGAYRDVFTAFPEGPNTDPRPRMEGYPLRSDEQLKNQVSGILPGG